MRRHLARVRVVPLPPARRHAVFRLAPDLLLVFKPAGHTEPAHVHAYRQRLQLVRGILTVQFAERHVTLQQRRARLTVAAGRRHATRAVEDTWLLVESEPI